MNNGITGKTSTNLLQCLLITVTLMRITQKGMLSFFVFFLLGLALTNISQLELIILKGLTVHEDEDHQGRKDTAVTCALFSVLSCLYFLDCHRLYAPLTPSRSSTN